MTALIEWHLYVFVYGCDVSAAVAAAVIEIFAAMWM